MTTVMFATLGRRLARGSAALLGGAAIALAFPPFSIWPGVLGYAVLMALWDDATGKAGGFWRGWLAGVAFFFISTWWVGEAFLVDAKEQAWMAPIAVALLAGGLGLFWGAAGALYAALRPAGITRPLLFAGCFGLMEWLRGHLLTGFPWDLAGETWPAGGAISQSASWAGAYGLGWLTTATAAAAALAFDARLGARRWAALGVAGAALCGLYAFGAARLAQPAKPAPAGPVVRVVQADVQQASKYDAALFDSILDRYTTLTAQPSARTPAVVIWPEGAIPAAAQEYLAPGSWTLARITAALKPGQLLLVGAARFSGDPQDPIVYNSLLALRDVDGGLEPEAVYDKYRLVPFGEYLPLESVLTPLGFKALTHIGDSFAAGPPPRPLNVDGMPPAQPLICYESLYPALARAGSQGAARPSWIVNVSNDAWFGPTSGPLQHLNLASYRAIEEGLPMVRATPTGVSAVIDAYGRIAPGARLGQGAMGVIDRPLPAALAPTFYSRMGDVAFWLLMAVSGTLAAIPRIKPLTRFKFA